MLRPQDKRTSFKQSNALSRLDKESMQKVFTLASGQVVTANRVVVTPNELTRRTDIHPFNPRCQRSLSLDSVRDILPSIEQEGVHTEGLATKDEQGVYLLLDSSRRRFCCLQAKKALPLWVLDGELSDSDLLALIKTTQAVKRLSYRELGAEYTVIMQEKGFTKLDELALYLGVGRETCRKRMAAAAINADLINAFPDCEGIPNSYYSKLVKIEKQLTKANTEISDFIASLDWQDIHLAHSVEDKQKMLLSQMEYQLTPQKKAMSWRSETLASFADKNTYAKVSTSADKRGLKIELNRLPAALYDDILAYIKQKIADET